MHLTVVDSTIEWSRFAEGSIERRMLLYKETERKPYLVVGIAFPVKFEDSYFLFESYKPDATVSAGQPAVSRRSETWRPDGAGRFADAEMRVVAEMHAVKLASDHYRDKGYEVTEIGKPYDLQAVKDGDELHVEVEGSIMSVQDVELAINEVRHASGTRTDLFVVDGIRLERQDDGKIRTSGGRERHWTDWSPADDALIPTRYRYRLPD